MNGYEKHSRDYGGRPVTWVGIVLAVAGIACLVAAAVLG